MSNKKIAVIVASSLAAVGIAAGGASLAFADGPSASPSATPSAGSSSTPQAGQSGQPRRGTVVSGDELAKVTAAVKTKDAGITVTRAVKKTDGSYVVRGTSNNTPVCYTVSADLTTVTAVDRTRQGKGNHARPADITGDELAKVTAAVQAKAPGVTVQHAWKDSDGYDVTGTLNGNRVHYEVSSDLQTVTQHTAGGKARGRHGSQSGSQSGSGSNGTGGGTGGTASPSPSATPGK